MCPYCDGPTAIKMVGNGLGSVVVYCLVCGRELDARYSPGPDDADSFDE